MDDFVPKNTNSIAAKIYVTSHEGNKKDRNFTVLYDLLNMVKTVDGKKLIQILDDVSGAGYTLFAPSDKGFTEAEKWLKKHKGKSLTDFSAEDIRATLLYHVLAGVVTRDALVEGSTPTTVSGKNVCIFVEGSGRNRIIFVNWAKIINADIQCANGVIHVIDHVLIPVNECDRGMMVHKKEQKKEKSTTDGISKRKANQKEKKKEKSTINGISKRKTEKEFKDFF